MSGLSGSNRHFCALMYASAPALMVFRWLHLCNRRMARQMPTLAAEVQSVQSANLNMGATINFFVTGRCRPSG